MLYDKEFLLQLDQCQHKVVYARITALTFQETPIEYVEGRVTQGSINLDGASAVRRTCSLTMVASEFNYSDYYWGLNTKFKLEIGLENTIDSTYPDIIWFNQGIYLITSFSTSHSTSSFNISIQGKDKMCLLNGDVGGSLESSVDFGQIEEQSPNGVWTIRQLPIYEIIRNLVHVYGGEPYHNIVINDLEKYGLELLEYRYDIPLFLYREINNPVYTNALLGGEDISCKVHYADGSIAVGTLDTIRDDAFESMVDTLVDLGTSPQIEIEGKRWHIAKITYGQTAGYRLTDLVYAGELVAKAGESLTSVLDKIKNMLTEFEYFYNLEGQFVFQKKQALKTAMWQFDDVRQPTNYVDRNRSYEFYGGGLITSFNNNPNLLNLRNDFSVWGEKTTATGDKVPIHFRYAIDKKPTRYNRITVEATNPQLIEYNKKYKTFLQGQASALFTTNEYDWREIIYQMAMDYYSYNFLDDFELRVAAANPIDYPTGRTGYEQYYIDLQGFWREIYYPGFENLFNADGEVVAYSELVNQIKNLTEQLFGVPPAKDSIYENNVGGIEVDLATLRNAPYEGSGIAGKTKQQYINEWWSESPPRYEFYYEEDGGTKTPIRNDEDGYLGMLTDYYFRQKGTLETKKYELTWVEEKFHGLNKDDYYRHDHENAYWNSKVFENPELLNFWFEFLDTEGELQQFSVKSIGTRSKVVNDNNVKSIYYRETPSVIYGEDSAIVNEEGFRYIHAANIDHMFTMSTQGKSAKDRLDELLYEHSYCIESATINSIPIYYLEPNTRIYIYDEKAGLDGDYIVSKLTIPLAYNGTMQITATKAAEKIL